MSTDELWTAIAAAVKQVAAGQATRVDGGPRFKVYAVAGNVRVDIATHVVAPAEDGESVGT
jgi:hypothetical protein